MKKILGRGHIFPVVVHKELKSTTFTGDGLILANRGGELYVVPDGAMAGWKSLFDFAVYPARFKVEQPQGSEYLKLSLASQLPFAKGVQLYYEAGERECMVVEVGNDDWFIEGLRIPEGKTVRLVDEGSCVVIYRF